MNTIHKTTALMAGITTLIVAMPAFAQDTADDTINQVRGRHPFRMEISDEVKAELTACRTDNVDKEAAQTCAKAVFEANGIEMPVHGGRKFGKGGPRGMSKGMFGRNLSDAVRAEIKACHENNEDRESTHSCAKAIFNANGIEMPRHQGSGRGKHGARNNVFRNSLSDEVKAELKTCRENNDNREDVKVCATKILKSNGIEMPEHVPEARRNGRRDRGFGFGPSNS